MPFADADSTAEDRSPEVCSSDNDVGCFYQVNDPSRNGVINTKRQGRPYRTYYRLKCSRWRKFNEIYQMAEDQSCKECEEAMDLTALS